MTRPASEIEDVLALSPLQEGLSKARDKIRLLRYPYAMSKVGKRSRERSTRAGQYVRQPEGYRAFLPKPLPPEDLEIDTELQALASKADLALGRLDGAVRVLLPVQD